MTKEETRTEETVAKEKEAAQEQAQEAVEEIKVAGDELVAKVREIIREGNVRHIIVKDEQGRTLIEVPFVLGAVGVLVAPVWAALGALAALAARFTIVVERMEE
jgi:hypothetical protein